MLYSSSYFQQNIVSNKFIHKAVTLGYTELTVNTYKHIATVYVTANGDVYVQYCDNDYDWERHCPKVYKEHTGKDEWGEYITLNKAMCCLRDTHLKRKIYKAAEMLRNHL